MYGKVETTILEGALKFSHIKPASVARDIITLQFDDCITRAQSASTRADVLVPVVHLFVYTKRRKQRRTVTPPKNRPLTSPPGWSKTLPSWAGNARVINGRTRPAPRPRVFDRLPCALCTRPISQYDLYLSSEQDRGADYQCEPPGQGHGT